QACLIIWLGPPQAPWSLRCVSIRADCFFLAPPWKGIYETESERKELRCSAEQRDGLHHTEGYASWAAAGDPRGPRPEVGGGAEATSDSSPASRLMFSLRPLGAVTLVMGSSNRTCGHGVSTSGLPNTGQLRHLYGYGALHSTFSIFVYLAS